MRIKKGIELPGTAIKCVDPIGIYLTLNKVYISIREYGYNGMRFYVVEDDKGRERAFSQRRFVQL